MKFSKSGNLTICFHKSDCALCKIIERVLSFV